MKKPNDSASESARLRQKAEMQAQTKAPVFPLSEADTQKLIHELEVHQIELEMQLAELTLAKKQLAESAAQKYKMLYDLAPSGYFTLTNEGEIIDANLTGSQMLGKKRSRLIGARFAFFVSNETKPEFNQFLDRAFNTKTKTTCEITLSVNDNQPMFVQIEGIVSQNEEQCLMTAIDLTEQKLAAQTLLETEKRYRMLFENSLTGIMITHPDGAILTANPQACRLLGRTEEDICKLGRNGVVDLSDPNLNIALEKRRLTGHFHGELIYKRSNGTVFPIDIETGIFTDANGHELAYIFFTDITERKQNEKILQQSEEKYRFMFANNPQPMWIFDLETLTFLEVNQAAVIHYGYSADEFLTMTLKDIRPPEDIPELMKYVGPSSLDYNHIGDFRHIKKNGEIIDVQITWHSVIFKGREARHALIHDVTEQNRIKASILKANWRLESVIEGTPIGIWEWNIQSGEAVFNEVWAQIIGYTLQELGPISINTWKEFAHPDDQILSDELLAKHFNGELPNYDIECRMKHKDGHWVWVHDRGRVTTRTEDGKPLMMFGSHTDITKRKQSEKNLLESERKYRMLFENSLTGILITHPDGSILAANPQACRLLERTEEDICKLGHNGVVDLSNPNLNIALEKHRLTGHFHGELTYKRSNGTIFPVDIESGIFTDVKGKEFAYSYFQDITERKQNENILLKQQELLAKLTQFSINLSILPTNNNLEEFICKQIKEFTGAVGVLFSEYDEETRIISPKHIEMEASLIGKVVRKLDNKIQNIHSIIDEKNYKRITQYKIEKYDSLTDATFGTISRPVSSALSILLNTERYIGISYMVDGNLYGTSLLAMGKKQPDLPIEFLENIASLIAISLRRKRAEEALIDSEYKYKLLTESNSDVVFIIDKLGQILFVNESAKKVLGYIPEEVIGKSLTSFVYEKQIPEAFLQLGSIFIHKEVTNFITKVYHKDKHLVDVEINGKIVGFNGQMVGQGTIRDITEKKQIEAKLKLSLDRNKALLVAIPDMMYVFDSACKIVDFHTDSPNQLYANPEIFLNKTIDEVFPPEVSLMAHQCVNGVLSTGKPDYSTYKLLKGDTLKYFESRFVLCGKNEVLSIVRDITDRKLAEEALLNRKLQYDNLVAKIPVGVYILQTKPDGTFALIYASPRLAEMAHISVESLLSDGEAIFKAIHPDDLDRFVTLNQEGIYQHRPFNWTGRIVADGNIKWMHFQSIPERIENGDTLWHGLVVDITERKLAEEALHESEEKYRNVFSTESDALFLIDHETGDILDVNESACQRYGYSKAEMLQLKNVDMSAEPEETQQATIKLEDRIELRYHKKKDGTVFPVDISASFFELKGRQIILAAIRDITYRVEAEYILKQKNEELSNLIAEKDKFFSIVAHDLRNPFNALLGFTQMLDEDLLTMELDQIKQISAILRSSAFSAYSLLENLLEWSRLKRGITSFEPETFILIHKIEESVKSVNELAIKKWIEINFSIHEDLVITADRNMLGSIIRNLLSNAIKFTPKYGNILISTQVNGEQSIEFSVRDSGIGMNKNLLDAIFNIDGHTNRKGTEGESSTGLGLTICKEFIEKHGGRIWAESEEGKGSTFYFTIPQARKV